MANFKLISERLSQPYHSFSQFPQRQKFNADKNLKHCQTFDCEHYGKNSKFSKKNYGDQTKSQKVTLIIA